MTAYEIKKEWERLADEELKNASHAARTMLDGDINTLPKPYSTEGNTSIINSQAVEEIQKAEEEYKVLKAFKMAFDLNAGTVPDSVSVSRFSL